MKYRILTVLLAVLLPFSLTACGQKTLLDKDEPVHLSMWHVYGEQADSPMDLLIDEFNATVGQEKGIVVNVTATSNATAIGPALMDAQSGKIGAGEMPDLFFCHPDNAAELGTENLVNWNDWFSADERDAYVSDFLTEGTVNDSLVVFPVSKSTHMLFINGSMFERFSKDTGVTYNDLATWNGFFAAAEVFHTWSDGKPFCVMDYMLRAVELSVLSQNPGEDFYTGDDWYDFDNAAWETEWNRFSDALVKGHIMVSDLYSNTQVMTGETACGLGSSAAILYYNDTVTYPDNTSEPMNLMVLPMPVNDGFPALDTQAGVGLCAYKTTDAKAEAAAVFAKWLTESERNLKFVTDTGYMPVTKEAFENLSFYAFENEAYRTLYSALNTVCTDYTFLHEPSFPGYYDKVNQLYAAIRAEQKDWADRFDAGESAAELTKECWAVFQTIR